MRRIWKGKVKNGKLTLDHRADFSLSLLEFEGENIELTIEKQKNYRSEHQNKYYWGVIIKMISAEIGLNAEDTHEVLKSKFNKNKITIKYKGKIYHKEIYKSTAILSTAEFEEFQSNIRSWAADFLNVYVPLPNEINF